LPARGGEGMERKGSGGWEKNDMREVKPRKSEKSVMLLLAKQEAPKSKTTADLTKKRGEKKRYVSFLIDDNGTLGGSENCKDIISNRL